MQNAVADYQIGLSCSKKEGEKFTELSHVLAVSHSRPSTRRWKSE